MYNFLTFIFPASLILSESVTLASVASGQNQVFFDHGFWTTRNGVNYNICFRCNTQYSIHRFCNSPPVIVTRYNITIHSPQNNQVILSVKTMCHNLYFLSDVFCLFLKVCPISCFFVIN